MDKIRLVIVEDDDREIQVCRDSVKRYNHQHQNTRLIEIASCKSVEEAKDCVDNSFDGAIIDLKLDVRGDEGSEVIDHIKQNFRIPVVVFTGTPLNVERDGGLIHIFKKGETGYDVIFDLFFDIYATGVTRVLGGRGEIEMAMNKVFWGSLVPMLESWQEYAASGRPTETAVLRFVINHLLELLEEPEGCFPEEMYLMPFEPNRIKTGQIVKSKERNEHFVVLSPACDLVVRDNGQMKTDRILLCGIETSDLISPMKNDTLKKIMRNTFTNYYHFLPRTQRFLGGVINFRRVQTVTETAFREQFEPASIQIAVTFTKDIIARFSSYYARQGQPDFDFESLFQSMKK